LIDGRVGLEEVLETAIADAGGAAFGTNDAGGHGFADAERIADGEANIAHADLVGVGKLEDGKSAGADLENGKIARGIRSYKRSRIGPFGIQVDLDVFGAVDDVVVGEDVSVGLHDDAGAEGTLDLGLGLAGDAAAEELAEEGIVEKGKLLRG